MTLTLAIRHIDRLDNGAPAELVLNRRGAMIGRSPTCDWSLPDPRNYISSRHCEVAFRNGFYLLSDVSTNGTFLNGGTERMGSPRRVAEGDCFLIGQYEVVAHLTGEAAAAIDRERDQAAQASSAGEWSGWDAHGGGKPPAGWDASDQSRSADLGDHAAPLGAGSGWNTPPPASSDWGTPPPAPASNWGAPASGAPSSDWSPAPSSNDGWAPVPAAPPAPGPSTWEPPAAAPPAASGWSSAAPDRPPPPTTNDVWGALAAGNVVDWAASGFGRPLHEQADPLGLDKPASPLPAPPSVPPAGGWASPPAAAEPPARTMLPIEQTQPPPAPASGAAIATQLADAFAEAAGLRPDQLKMPSATTLDRAGQLLRRLVGGLVVMVEARARAKSQMGAEATSLSFDGNNPIKFARSPDQALAQLLNPVERGFMDADKAIDDAFYDLQSHQMATLKAMQGALRATLDRFSPTAIRARAEQRGLFQRIMPGAREAALWQAYEREFGGVAQGSDEAFMDMFAKEFRRAYEEQSRSRKR